MTVETHLIVIGETIVNLTYWCAPPKEGSWVIPYASFDEEYLEMRDENLDTSVSLQGALCIAEYWYEETRQVPVSFTAVAKCPVDRAVGFPHQCNEGSLGKKYVAPVVHRVLRRPQPRIGGASRRPRPHLRIDRVGDQPADFSE